MISSEIACWNKFGSTETPHPSLNFADARLIQSTPFRDLRGSFELAWDKSQLAWVQIKFNPTSSAFSYNKKSGTIRGLHYQKPPHAQAKLVSCVNGIILDVIADMRPESPTYLHWGSTELSAASGRSIYIPAGYAHGFLTLTDHATLGYLIEGDYLPDAAATVRWNDPALGIEWSTSEPILAERDRQAPDLLS